MSTADSLEYRMFSEHPLWPAVEPKPARGGEGWNRRLNRSAGQDRFEVRPAKLVAASWPKKRSLKLENRERTVSGRALEGAS